MSEDKPFGAFRPEVLNENFATLSDEDYRAIMREQERLEAERPRDTALRRKARKVASLFNRTVH